MRPITPNFNFSRQAGPSSPPATPTTTTSNSTSKKSRRQGIANFDELPPLPPTVHTNNGSITPVGSGTNFSYNRFELHNLSPHSSSPASLRNIPESEADSAPARSSSSPVVGPVFESPPKHARINIVTEESFTVEEFGFSDYEGFNSECESVLLPHQYEDAVSEKARSTRASTPRPELDDKVVNGLRDLDCGAEERDVEEQFEAWSEKRRQERRRKRRSSGSGQKRSLGQSIGSETDEEDLQRTTFEGANEAGSSARRLRRKVVGERTSLIFDDPPAERIEEVDEPDSEEGIAFGEVEEVVDGEKETWDKEMPLYGQDDMDVDADDCKE